METIKLYDIDAYETEFEAKVVSCVKQESVNASGQTGMVYEVVLNQTLFFPEEGGQTPDRGTLGGIPVFDVQIRNGIISHFLPEPLEEGRLVKGEIDWRHRFYNMQQHSGEHLFSGLAYKRFGYRNVGFHLSDQIVTMDFDGVFMKEQLEEMEWAINEAIAANVEIKTGYPSKEELKRLEYRSKIEIDGPVRIVGIEGYDVCACCAPHVHRTGEIGIFKIQSVQNYKGGVRISFLCGFRALEEYRKKAEIISELSGILTTNQELLAENVSKLKAEKQSLKSRLMNANRIIMESKIENIPEDQTNVLLFETDLDTQVMRNAVNMLMEKHSGICGVFAGNDEEGYNYIIGSKNADCRDVAAKMRTELGAKGGGSAQMVQGTVHADKEQLMKLLKAMK